MVILVGYHLDKVAAQLEPAVAGTACPDLLVFVGNNVGFCMLIVKNVQSRISTKLVLVTTYARHGCNYTLLCVRCEVPLYVGAGYGE